MLFEWSATTPLRIEREGEKVWRLRTPRGALLAWAFSKQRKPEVA